MNRVFITQSPMRRNARNELVPKFDLSSAREYGKLEILMPAGPVYIDAVPAVASLRQKLARFDRTDHLLCLGDPVLIAAASAIVAELNENSIPLLVWDRQISRYNAITVEI